MDDLVKPRHPWRFELSAVKIILRLFKVEHDRRELDKEFLDTDRFTPLDPAASPLNWFRARYPRFPLILVSWLPDPTYSARHVDVARLFTSPSRSMIMKTYLDLQRRKWPGDNRPAGLHVPYGPVPGGFILHPPTVPTGEEAASIVLDDQHCRIESLTGLCKAIRAQGWTPSTPLSLAGPGGAATQAMTTPADRDLVEAVLGRNITSRLLMELVRATPPRQAVRASMRDIDDGAEDGLDAAIDAGGESGGVSGSGSEGGAGGVSGGVFGGGSGGSLAISQRDLVRRLRCSERSIKIAVRELRDQGLLSIVRAKRGNIYSIESNWRERLAELSEAKRDDDHDEMQ